MELPFPTLMNSLIDLAKQNPWGVTPDSFVFWTEYKKDIPMRGQTFVEELPKALIKIGFTDEEAANYDFHCWRHFFTSYMIKKLDKKLLKSQTGHKTDVMLDHYSDHEVEGDRQIIQEKKRETFAGLIPERALLEYNSDNIYSVA